MKTLLACLIASPLLAAAQAPAPPTCDGPEWKQFDFWVGDWDLSYKAADGKVLASRNKVTKILGGCVLLEQFSGAPGTKLDGHSVSTFDRNARQWKQTWVDNTGSYLDFTGGFADAKMILARDAERQGKKFRQRMVWQDIRADAFKWLWQRSDDGGATWSTQWEIDYRRAKQGQGRGDD
jgi:hypothetical protein